MDRSKETHNLLIIDLNVWTTQTQKAHDSSIKLTTISQQIVRTKKGQTPNPVEYWEIPQLGITLVKKQVFVLDYLEIIRFIWIVTSHYLSSFCQSIVTHQKKKHMALIFLPLVAIGLIISIVGVIFSKPNNKY